MSEKAPQIPDDELDLSLKKKKKKKSRVAPDESVEAAAEKLAEASLSEAKEDKKEAKKETKKEEKKEDDDDMDLDLSKKKKKKKKAAEEDKAEKEDKPEADEENEDADMLDLSKKKKKKKKVVVVEEPQEEEEEEDIDLELEQLGKKKKKKTKKKKDEEEKPQVEEGDDSGSSLPWAGSDRDYTYDELLHRVTEILKVRNPELSGDKRKFLMKPPQVVREGTKRTVFLNFHEICRFMHRDQQMDHVFQFMLVELGTSGSIDGSKRMVIKGRFQPKAIENIIRRYVVEYVTCHSCRSPDTLLRKDNRLFFLLCNQCGAQRSVSAIKTGYVAQVGKRKKV